jgi:hypothetical protein
VYKLCTSQTFGDSLEEPAFKKLKTCYGAIEEAIKNLDAEITAKSLSKPTSVDEFNFVDESLEVVKKNIDKIHIVAGTSIC